MYLYSYMLTSYVLTYVHVYMHARTHYCESYGSSWQIRANRICVAYTMDPCDWARQHIYGFVRGFRCSQQLCGEIGLDLAHAYVHT